MVLLNMISDLAELKAKTRDCKYIRKIECQGKNQDTVT